jgi:hypothetical protein
MMGCPRGNFYSAGESTEAQRKLNIMKKKSKVTKKSAPAKKGAARKKK